MELGISIWNLEGSTDHMKFMIHIPCLALQCGRACLKMEDVTKLWNNGKYDEPWDDNWDAILAGNLWDDHLGWYFKIWDEPLGWPFAFEMISPLSNRGFMNPGRTLIKRKQGFRARSVQGQWVWRQDNFDPLPLRRWHRYDLLMVLTV